MSINLMNDFKVNEVTIIDFIFDLFDTYSKMSYSLYVNFTLM